MYLCCYNNHIKTSCCQVFILVDLIIVRWYTRAKMLVDIEYFRNIGSGF